MTSYTTQDFPEGLSSATKLDKPSEVVTGIEFYKHSIKNEDKRRHRSYARKGMRNGAVLLLSNYKPKDFGNAQIDLTVDGGQHLRSPGEEPPKISNKNIE